MKHRIELMVAVEEGGSSVIALKRKIAVAK
jgi:hypothetical protein